MSPLPDDDPDKWVYKPHTRAKHEVLWKYLDPWTKKLSKAAHGSPGPATIRVVDCFAGRARYTAVETTEAYELDYITSPTDAPGSPQIILERLTQFDQYFDRAECVFIESNDTNFRSLVDVITFTSYSDKIEVILRHGRFEDVILEEIGPNGTDFPTFLFIDPFGFKSLDYDVVTELGSRRYCDILITFMSRAMNRFLDSEFHEAALDQVFGTPNWRDEIDSYDLGNWEPLVEYYEERLKVDGPSYTFPYMVSRGTENETVYYLVFGSNSPSGIHTFREVVARCGTGNFAYAPGNPNYDRQQKQLFGGIDATREFLMSQFNQHRITFNQLVHECSANFPHRTETASEYREALHDLESEKAIEIIRRDSKRDGIRGADLIDFRTPASKNLPSK